MSINNSRHRHWNVFGQHIRWDYDLARTASNTNNNFKFKHTHQYKRTRCLSRVHMSPFQEHGANHSRPPAITSVVCSVFGQHMIVRLRPPCLIIPRRTRLKGSNAITHWCERTSCPFRDNKTPLDTSFREHKRTTVIVVAVYLNSTLRWDYDLIRHRTRIATSNWTIHQCERTIFPCRGTTRHNVACRIFNRHARTPVIDIVVYLDSTSRWDYDPRPHRKQMAV